MMALNRGRAGGPGKAAAGEDSPSGRTLANFTGPHRFRRHGSRLRRHPVPPIIVRQPASCSNATGTAASFSVEEAGGVPLSYQWRRQGTNLVDGGNISGVTTTHLLLTDVQLADAAGYSVVITNAYSSTTSSVAQLTVAIPPSPGRFTNFSFSPVMGFSFIFRDATVGKPYRIQRSPSLAEGSWVDWQSFTYTEPIFLTDMGAERRLYRAVSP